MDKQRYTDKVVVITGAASGIGRATVLGMVREGARVAFSDIRPDAGKAMAEELTSQGAEVMFIQADATLEPEVESMIGQVVERWGRLDVGINNVGNMGAADSLGVPIHETSLEGWRSTMEVALTSKFLGMKHQLKQMVSQGGGVIANTTSMAGVRITPHSSPAYAAGKAAVVHLTRYAAVLYAKQNIRVNVIAPGLTATETLLGVFPTEAERNNLAGEFHPMGRMMTPDELANAFLWVCSDEASGITGLTIPVDGGWTAT